MYTVWPAALSAALVLVLAQLCAVVALYAQIGALLFDRKSRYLPLITDDGPPLHALLPPLTGSDPYTGRPVAASEFRGREFVVLFMHPACVVCARLLKSLRVWQRSRREETAMLLVVRSSRDQAVSFVGAERGVQIIEDPDGLRFDTCGVRRTPLGLLVDSFGYVRMKGVVSTVDQLSGLIAGQGREIGGLSWSPMVEEDGSAFVHPETGSPQEP